MRELPSDPEGLLMLARLAQGEPEAEVRARVRRGVADALIAGAAVSIAAAAETRVAAKGGWSGALAAKLVLAVAACAVVVGVFLSSGSEPGSSAGDRRASVPAAAKRVAAARPRSLEGRSEERPIAESSVSVPPLVGKPKFSSTQAVPPPRSLRRPSAATPSLRAELTLLEQAERAIDEGEPGRALTLLQRHRVRFVSSSFEQERDGLSLIARCMTEPAATVAEATRFLSQESGAVLHDRVRTACQAAR